MEVVAAVLPTLVPSGNAVVVLLADLGYLAAAEQCSIGCCAIGRWVIAPMLFLI
jgi:hypothetical protein